MNFTRQELFDLQCALQVRIAQVEEDCTRSTSESYREANKEHRVRLWALVGKVRFQHRLSHGG